MKSAAILIVAAAATAAAWSLTGRDSVNEDDPLELGHVSKPEQANQSVELEQSTERTKPGVVSGSNVKPPGVMPSSPGSPDSFDQFLEKKYAGMSDEQLHGMLVQLQSAMSAEALSRVDPLLDAGKSAKGKHSPIKVTRANADGTTVQVPVDLDEHVDIAALLDEYKWLSKRLKPYLKAHPELTMRGNGDLQIRAR
ncbi:MAG: hypothetical protein GY722_11830 [bacterium]|nr:hypothetical protein [bacterium]